MGRLEMGERGGLVDVVLVDVENTPIFGISVRLIGEVVRLSAGRLGQCTTAPLDGLLVAGLRDPADDHRVRHCSRLPARDAGDGGDVVVAEAGVDQALLEVCDELRDSARADDTTAGERLT